MMFRTFRRVAEAFEWRRLCIADGFAVEGPFRCPMGWGLTWYKAH